MTTPSLAEALDAWWEAAVAEGREGRTHDTEGGAAQRALQDIWAAHTAAAVAAATAARRVAFEQAAARCEQVAAHDTHMTPKQIALYLAAAIRGLR